jgi:hypothetical protein
LKAARRAGFEHVRVEIDPEGKIVAIVVGDKPKEVTSENSVDRWIAKHARQTQGN